MKIISDCARSESRTQHHSTNFSVSTIRTEVWRKNDSKGNNWLIFSVPVIFPKRFFPNRRWPKPETGPRFLKLWTTLSLNKRVEAKSNKIERMNCVTGHSCCFKVAGIRADYFPHQIIRQPSASCTLAAFLLLSGRSPIKYLESLNTIAEMSNKKYKYYLL